MTTLAPPGYHLLPSVGFSVGVTTVPAAILSAALNAECIGVVVQSSSFDDSDNSVTGVMYVEVNGVKVWELITGESSALIPCSNTSEIKVVTLSGTAWARGIVYRAAKQG